MTSQIQLPSGKQISVEEMTAQDVIQLALQEFSQNRQVTPNLSHSMRVVDSEGHIIQNTRQVPQEGRVVAWGPYGTATA